MCVARTQLNRHLSLVCQLCVHSPTPTHLCFKDLTRVSTVYSAQGERLPASLSQVMLPGHTSVTSMGPFISGGSAIDMDVPHSNGMHENYDPSYFQWLQLSSFHRAEQSSPACSSKLNASAGAHAGDHEGIAHSVTENLVSQQRTADCYRRSYGNSAAPPYTDTNCLTRGPGKRGLAPSALEHQSSIWYGPNEHLGLVGVRWGSG